MTASNALITQIYIGYFNRAPDPAGLNYWVGDLQGGMPVATIAENFARQGEAVSTYAYLANPVGGSADAFLTSVYNNLFNHAPDAAGLSYWKGELAAGKPVGRMIIDIISGAQGSDKTVIDNKVAVAQSYVAQIGGNIPHRGCAPRGGGYRHLHHIRYAGTAGVAEFGDRRQWTDHQNRGQHGNAGALRDRHSPECRRGLGYVGGAFYPHGAH